MGLCLLLVTKLAEVLVEDVVININNLNVWYEKHHVLKNIVTSFPAKSITALIGPSGCGKTTLLRSINRLTANIPGCVTQGQILVNDTDIISDQIDLFSLRRSIGMLFQKPNPFPFSIMENMLIPLKFTGEKNLSVMRDKAVTYLRVVGLFDEINGRIESSSALNLSTGQQQRLCLARMLITEPKILLLDEPCSALDPLSTHYLEGLFNLLSEQASIVIATHSLSQAKRIANQTTFLLDGEIIERGKTQQLFTAPKDDRTKGYVSGDYG